MLTTDEYVFRAHIEKVLRCTHNVLVKSEYIQHEYKYEYITLELYE